MFALVEDSLVWFTRIMPSSAHLRCDWCAVISCSGLYSFQRVLKVGNIFFLLDNLHIGRNYMKNKTED